MDAGDFRSETDYTPEEPSPPSVFVRGVTVAPAMPWDQARAAGLEARLNAPLVDVACQVQRLSSWRLGGPGRFAAVYVRQSDVGDGLTVRPELDGKIVVAHFVPPAQRARQVRQFALVAGAAALGAFLLLTVIAAIWTGRSQNAQQLADLEQTVAVRSRQAAAESRSAAQVRALDTLGMRDRRAGRVLGDLAWAAQARDPAVSVEAFHWQDGLVAVEVRGGAAPFLANDRLVRRAPAQIRRGVWLWGAQPAAGPGAAP